MTVSYGSGGNPDPLWFPKILAIGDSWFWYPLPSGYNLLEQLASNVLKSEFSNVLSLGYIGATLESYVDGQFEAAFKYQLAPINAKYYSAVFISGAGNDAVDYSLALKGDCTGISVAADCLDPVKLDDLMRKLSGWLGMMIHDIHWAFQDAPPERQPHVFVHCYDYPVPDGRGAQFAGIPLLGPWLMPALNTARVANDPTLQFEVVKCLIDRLQKTFDNFDDESRNVHVIDSPGTLNPATDWDNELHPNTAGFQKLAVGPWRTSLARYGFA